MSTIKHGQILLYFCFNKIIKRSETSFQPFALNQKHARNAYHTSIWQGMPMMTSKKNYKNFTKTQKSGYLENKTLFLQINKFIDYISRATLLQKIVL